MTCPACAKAAHQLSGEFIGGCRGCSIRKLARGPELFESRQADRQTSAYLAALARAGANSMQLFLGE